MPELGIAPRRPSLRGPGSRDTQRSDGVIFPGPHPPRGRFVIPSRFLTAPGPGESPSRPKFAKSLRPEVCNASAPWARARQSTSIFEPRTSGSSSLSSTCRRRRAEDDSGPPPFEPLDADSVPAERA
eukprot:7362013-Pyramimonas_sp.AAC.1